MAESSANSPDDSLNGSAGRQSGGSSSSTTNDRSALCRGIAVGRVTPQNITLPQSNHNHSQPKTNGIKKLAPKPPAKPTQPFSSKLHPGPHQVTCNAKNSVNNVYIESYPAHNQHAFNQLSIMNLETTEL